MKDTDDPRKSAADPCVGGKGPSPLHSAECFGEQRDFWWHRDFLDLMAARWRLREASSLADIGCGLCHWSRLLYPYLRAPARFAGVDRKARWVAEAPEHFRRAFPKVAPGSITFHQGDAARLPLPDNSFDVATCQTLLMHLAPPPAALRRNVLWGGGNGTCFETVLAEFLQNSRLAQQSIAAGAFHAGGGAITYLVSGRKP